jgi:hypothetical protein
MYVRSDVARQMHQDMLDEAQARRNGVRVSALNRARRRAARAEERMSRARVEASRHRRRLEAEL